jgi:alkanesulfonate monooxygenase SsuD/methylene tetrahydromethanopterin reductase-like flavin-dependent oxidoreductase (luciferase family)
VTWNNATMRLGISLPYEQPDGAAPTAARIASRARLIEKIGFDVIAQGDHVGSPHRPTPDVLTWLTAAASATERVELASAIIQVPLRRTVELAHRLINLHAVSGGRFLAGLGAGSTRADYDAVGVEFENRFRRLAEALPAIKRLCRGEQVGAARFKSWAQTPAGPPLLIGAWASGPWVRRAARDYAGWMASGHTTYREIAEGIKIFRDWGGQRAMLVSVTVDLHATRQTPAADERFTLACGPEEAADWLHRLDELGYDDVCLVRLGHTEADLTEDDLWQIRALVPRG